MFCLVCAGSSLEVEIEGRLEEDEGWNSLHALEG